MGWHSAALCQELKAALTNSTWLRVRAELTHPGELQWEGCAELSHVMGLAAQAAFCLPGEQYLQRQCWTNCTFVLNLQLWINTVGLSSPLNTPEPAGGYRLDSGVMNRITAAQDGLDWKES